MKMRCARPPRVRLRAERLLDGTTIFLMQSGRTGEALSLTADFVDLWRFFRDGATVEDLVVSLVRDGRGNLAEPVRAFLDACREHALLEPC